MTDATVSAVQSAIDNPGPRNFGPPRRKQPDRIRPWHAAVAGLAIAGAIGMWGYAALRQHATPPSQDWHEGRSIMASVQKFTRSPDCLIRISIPNGEQILAADQYCVPEAKRQDRLTPAEEWRGRQVPTTNESAETKP